MSANKFEIKPRSVHVYDLDEFEKLLKGVGVATCMLTETPQVVDEESVIKRVNALTLGGAPGGEQCSCCGAGPFTSRAQQTAHYKHHWHAYNLKRKLFGKTTLTLNEFNSRQDDNSSVSGSESEVEGSTDPATELFAAATRHCKAFFTNPKGKVFCIYRCLLHHRKETLSTDGEGHAWVRRVKDLAKPGSQRWAVLMVSGGHFAGAIYSGGVAAIHKTLHSYVVRRGQGQAQGTRDQHGSAPKSAGASLRRYNQEQFCQHVQDILNSWRDDLAGCYLILYRASGPINQGALFGKGSPINREDKRVRVMPFPTKKPTFKEVQRAHATVSNLDVYDTMELFQQALISASGKPVAKTGSDSSVTERSRKVKSTPSKVIDRAKSREPAPRELPTQVTSSEDEGPCFIDLETPANWIKTLSEQSSNGVITNSRKDLLKSCSISDASSDSETENTPQQKNKKKKKKKQEEQKNVKRGPQKIPPYIKKMWKVISGKEVQSLDTIMERWEGDVNLLEACNVVDPADGNTALHKAAIAAKPDMVMELLGAGGDPCVRNHQQQTPYAATPHHETRLAFRMFQANNPDKYNYAKAHIPGPITPEQIEQDKEKKALQKRAKRQREKEKQVEKIKSTKFLQMTDNQKMHAIEERCFLCGSQLPKIPFMYEEYQFCNVRCLQSHRNLRPLNLPA